MVTAKTYGSGSPVVLIHGLGTSARSWRKNIEPLARDFCVHTLDLDGFGRNAEGHFDLAQSWRKVRAWMRRRGLESANFIGHSLGGRIAAELAAECPRRVTKLVLVDAAGIATQRSTTAQITGVAGELAQTPKRLLELVIRGSLKAGVQEVLRVADRLSREDIENKLHHITVPTLVLWGGRDRTLPLKLGRRMQRKIPGSQIRVLENAGHSPQWEAAEDFNLIVSDFLRSAERGPRSNAEAADG